MIMDHLRDFHLFRLSGPLKQPLFQVEAVHTFQIESQTDERPFARCGQQATQRKLAKAEDLFDDANNRFDGAFTQTINCLSDLGLEFVGRLDDGAGLVWRWFGLLLEKGVPIEMMRFASGGDIGINSKFLATLDVGFTEVPSIQGDGVRPSKLRRDRLQGGQGFLFIVGMIREGVGHNQQTFLIYGHLHIVVLVKAVIGAVLHDVRIGIGEVEYLICTIGNYTSSHLAEHLDEVSHDVVTDYLRSERLTGRGLWELVFGLIQDSPEAFLLVDDSVQDKRYSQFIELVKLQYSGAEHGLVCGIGIVNLVHSAGAQKDVYPMDYRIYAPDQDGKTKNEHFSEMVIKAVYAKKIKAKHILFDSWYASAENLKLVHRLGLTFFTTLKSNRMVSLSKEGGWIHLDAIDWTAERLNNGLMVKLKAVPFKVQLFKVVATDGDSDWVITNCPEATLTSQAAQDANDVRWQIEDLHRGLKQLTGTEKCQCRKGRSQRNHSTCCYHAWLSLKIKAKALGKTLYKTKEDLLSDYLQAELTSPRIHAFTPV